MYGSMKYSRLMVPVPSQNKRLAQQRRMPLLSYQENIHNQTFPLTTSHAARYSASQIKSATVLCMELFHQITQLLRHT